MHKNQQCSIEYQWTTLKKKKVNSICNKNQIKYLELNLVKELKNL